MKPSIACTMGIYVRVKTHRKTLKTQHSIWFRIEIVVPFSSKNSSHLGPVKICSQNRWKLGENEGWFRWSTYQNNRHDVFELFKRMRRTSEEPSCNAQPVCQTPILMTNAEVLSSGISSAKVIAPSIYNRSIYPVAHSIYPVAQYNRWRGRIGHRWSWFIYKSIQQLSHKFFLYITVLNVYFMLKGIFLAQVPYTSVKEYIF